MASDLNDKQKRFCEEYLKDLNATQAAIRAGYSKKTAGSIGQENLTKPEIQKYLSKRQQDLQTETGITIKKVLDEYARIAFSDLRLFYNEDGTLKKMSELSEEAAAALAGIETDEIWEGTGEDRELTGFAKKVKRWDKVKALDSLARHLGMFGKDNEQLRPLVQITGMKIT